MERFSAEMITSGPLTDVTGINECLMTPQHKINIESLMSCHLLHELANMILCEALPSII